MPNVYNQNNQLVENGISASWDNNYEIVRFIARKTGAYEVRVTRISTGYDEDNDLGIAVARIYRTFVPLILKSP